MSKTGKFDKKKGYKKRSNANANSNMGCDSNNRDRSANASNSDKVIDMYKSRNNDWRWYAQNEQLLKDVASYAFGYPLGAKFKTIEPSPSAPELTVPSQNANSCALPGVLSVRLVPTVGYSDNPNSPINMCARNLYTFIRAANSGAKNYDSTDLMLYLIAMDSAYSFLAWMKRLYGVISVTNVENRYYPWAVTHACGGLYSDLRMHLADFRAYINMFALRLASLCIPSHMSYMRRHQWIYEGIFLDDTIGKSQTYCFTPEGFHVFDLDSTHAGYCKFMSFDAFGMDGSYDAIVRYGSAILNPILNGAGEEDFNLIAGDILKAYGESGVYRAEMISETYTVLPTTESTALEQIQNARTMPIRVGNADLDKVFDITQDSTKNYLVATPKVEEAWGESGGYRAISSIYRGNYLLNTYATNPGPEQAIENSRLMNMIGDDLGIHTVGSEIATRFYFYYFMETSKGWDLVQSSANRNDINFEFAQDTDVLSPGDVATALEKLSQITAFRYHPYLSSVISQINTNEGGTVTGAYYPTAPIGDTSAFTLVNNTNLQMMSEVALLSEFGLQSYK